MSETIVKKGEIICVASGVYEGYGTAGPYVVVQQFSLDAFIESVTPAISEPWEIDELMRSLPQLLLEKGLISELPCRRIYLGAWGEFGIQEGKDDL